MAHLIYTLEVCYGEEGNLQYDREERVKDFPEETTLKEIFEWKDRINGLNGFRFVGNVKLLR